MEPVRKVELKRLEVYLGFYTCPTPAPVYTLVFFGVRIVDARFSPAFPDFFEIILLQLK